MIAIKGKGIGIQGSRITTYANADPGSGSRTGAVGSRRVETAAASAAVNSGMSAAGGSNAANGDGFLTGLFPDGSSMHAKAYRDMYDYDAIAGSAVDLQSELPFSDFTLYGVDSARLDVYQSAIARLNIRSTAAQNTRHYLVDGVFASTLVFDQRKATFIDQIPYAAENLTLDYTPLASQDPIITAKVDSKFKEFLSSSDSAFVNARKLIPSQLLSALKSGEFTLDPLATLFMARRPFLNGDPVSYLKRCLPAYLIEKTLYRGTIFEAGRRQRANVHVSVGDEAWEPTPEELSAVVNLFQQTDLDPMGAIVATRNGINVSEFRTAGDFWKWTDVFDVLTTIKLKAMGISDAFLSSESTYSNADSALVVFMENLNAYRDLYTHCVFTNKLFPLIAMVKGYRKKGAETAGAEGLSMKTVNDYSQLDIPKVRWSKRLTAGNDANLYEALEKMSEKGIPVPYRLWIAASGIDPETLVNELDDDKKLKERLDKAGAHVEETDDLMGGSDFGGGGEDDSGGSDFQLSSLAHIDNRGLGKIKNLANMDFGNLSDAHTEDSKGGRHFASNQTKANRKINEQIAKSAARMAVDETYGRTHRDLVAAGMLKRGSRPSETK